MEHIHVPTHELVDLYCIKPNHHFLKFLNGDMDLGHNKIFSRKKRKKLRLNFNSSIASSSYKGFFSRPDPL